MFTPVKHAAATKRLSQVRVGMMGRKGAAFITSVCMSLEQVLTLDVPRAATDGTHIYYNPEWLMSINYEQMMGVVVHETWHVALRHCVLQKQCRMGTRVKSLWDLAADIVINNFILLHSNMKLPDDIIFMPEYDGMSTEEIYAILYKKDANNEPVPMLPPEQQDVLEDPTADQSDEDSNNHEKIQVMLAKAKLASDLAGDETGNMPGELQMYLKQLIKPKLNWQQILIRFCRARAKNKLTWKRPNRRYPDSYMPSKMGTKLDHITVAVDMSASVDDEEVAMYVSEIASVLKKANPKKLELVEFDVRVTNSTVIEDVKQLTQHAFTGRGGTDVNGLLTHVNNHKTDILVVFTDGYFYPPDVTTKLPVLWCIYNNSEFKSDIGKTIHVDKYR